MTNKHTMQVNGKLLIVERLKNSYSGNPRYLCMVGETAFYTKPDSVHGYSITNHRDTDITVELSMYRGKLSLDRIVKE